MIRYNNELFKRFRCLDHTSKTPVKNNGEISESFSTARRATDTMLNACKEKKNSQLLSAFIPSQ